MIRPESRTARNRSGRVAALVGAMIGAVALAGCGAGQITQTSDQVAAVAGANATVGPIAIRNARIEFDTAARGAAIYLAGSSAPLDMSIVGTGYEADTLVSASSPVASAVQISGTTTIPGGRTLVVDRRARRGGGHADSHRRPRCHGHRRACSRADHRRADHYRGHVDPSPPSPSGHGQHRPHGAASGPRSRPDVPRHPDVPARRQRAGRRPRREPTSRAWTRTVPAPQVHHILDGSPLGAPARPEYARYEDRVPAHPAETWIRRYAPDFRRGH